MTDKVPAGFPTMKAYRDQLVPSHQSDPAIYAKHTCIECGHANFDVRRKRGPTSQEVIARKEFMLEMMSLLEHLWSEANQRATRNHICSPQLEKDISQFVDLNNYCWVEDISKNEKERLFRNERLRQVISRLALKHLPTETYEEVLQRSPVGPRGILGNVGS